jgi:phosphoglycolate phosphatase-like HAD superfamily hydrolase
MSINKEILRLIEKKTILVFDFDGVIANSINIKANAFYHLYLPYGKKIAQKVLEHHNENGGMSRFDKFRHYQNVFLGKKIAPHKIELLSKKFSEMVVKGVIESPEIDGVGFFIDRCCNQFRSCDINSATPQEEIEFIVNQRGIKKYFRNTYGSPTTKIKNLEKSLNKKDKSSIVFFGDSKLDMFAADKLNIDFIGIGEHMFDIIDANNPQHFAVISFLDLACDEF